MKKTLFIISHLRSGSSELYSCLSDNPRVQGCNSKTIYDNPYSLIKLINTDHKLESKNSIYMEEILYNFKITSKEVYSIANIIFVLRDPIDSLNEIVQKERYNLNEAFSYYCFRMRRIAGIVKYSKSAILIDYDELLDGNAINRIEKFLNLGTPLKLNLEAQKIENKLPLEVVNKVQDCYEKYMYKIKKYSSNLTLS